MRHQIKLVNFKVSYPNPPLLFLGNHHGNDVFYFSAQLNPLDSLPGENWICLGIANAEIDKPFFEEFIYYSLQSGLLEFKSQGKYGKQLHDTFVENVREEEIEGKATIDIMTTWCYGETRDLDNAFWGCFYANVLPDQIDSNQTKVVCIPFDGQDYREVLIKLIEKLNQGWMPPDD